MVVHPHRWFLPPYVDRKGDLCLSAHSFVETPGIASPVQQGGVGNVLRMRVVLRSTDGGNVSTMPIPRDAETNERHAPMAFARPTPVPASTRRRSQWDPKGCIIAPAATFRGLWKPDGAIFARRGGNATFPHQIGVIRTKNGAIGRHFIWAPACAARLFKESGPTWPGCDAAGAESLP